jgi:single-stranded DNA-binding protein
MDPDIIENEVIIAGSVLRYAESRQIRSGLRIIDFTLSVNDPDGERDVYVDCYGTNELCDMVGDHVDEGDVLQVTGHLTYRTFTDQRGQKRSGLVVCAESAVAPSNDVSYDTWNEILRGEY